ncbi:MAG: glutamate synthase subunit beta [Zetaproteobacteria bacterium]|nr:glutamate synthase subunit beta [Zetaproteobacteria bacterium]
MSETPGFLKYHRQSEPLRDPQNRLQDFKEHPITTPDTQLATQQSVRCMDCGVAFCMSGCPLGNPIPQFNRHVAAKDWQAASEILHQTNNFPEFTGRICPAPCESACVLGLIQEPVNIKYLENKILQQAFAQNMVHAQPPQHESSKRVVIVGSGPAGLACAQQLRRAGHGVHIIDKAASPGGLLTYGIPEYKLPYAVVHRRIEQLKQEGITFQLQTEVGKDIHYSELRREYDAIVLCLGAEQPRDLPLAGRHGQGIHFAMEFLGTHATRHWTQAPSQDDPWLNPQGKRVIIIGGGDTGSDCIGVSLRLGAKSVTNFELSPRAPNSRSTHNPWPQYRRTYRESSSMAENKYHGGTTEYNIATKRFILNHAGHVQAVDTVRVVWHESGEYKEVAGSEQTWACDLALIATGYTHPLTTALEDTQDILHPQTGLVHTDPQTKMTSTAGVFAAGDCRRGQSLVVWAIAEGRDTAHQVDNWLMQRPSKLPKVRTQTYDYS